MLTLVIPVYRNEASLPDLLSAVEALSRDLGGAMETVFVVDGSPDRSFEILREQLPRRALKSKLVLLSRNFGSFSAIRAGLAHGEGERFAVMAAVLRQGDVDVVVGVRESRGDPWSDRVPAQIFWSLYRRYVVPDMPPGGVDVFACTRTFRDMLLRMNESHTSLIAQVFWLGYRRATLPYERQARQYGKSSWTLRKKVSYLMDSVFAFTDLPIRLLIRGGLAGATIAGLFGVGVIMGRLGGWVTVPGYAATAILIIFFGALNLLGLGIVGSYAWRAYENSKARPLAVELRVERFGPVAAHD